MTFLTLGSFHPLYLYRPQDRYREAERIHRLHINSHHFIGVLIKEMYLVGIRMRFRFHHLWSQ